jgi:hypothetical protein
MLHYHEDTSLQEEETCNQIDSNRSKHQITIPYIINRTEKLVIEIARDLNTNQKPHD